MEPTETVRESITELSEVLLQLSNAPTPAQRDRAARCLDRIAEELAEAATALRS